MFVVATGMYVPGNYHNVRGGHRNVPGNYRNVRGGYRGVPGKLQ